MENEFDNEFAERLRATDRPVALDPQWMAGQMVGARKTNARRCRRLVIGSAVTAGLIVSLAVLFIPRNQTAGQDGFAGEVGPLNQKIELQTELLQAESSQRTRPMDAAILAESHQQIEALNRIENLKSEIAELNQARVEQQRALARAEFSRTEVSFKSIANYKF